MASGDSTDHIHPHALWQHHKLRRPNPENEPFSVSYILQVLRARAIVQLGSISQSRACISSRPLYTTLPALPSKDMHLCQEQLYLTPVVAAVTVSPVLSSFSPLHHTLFIKMPLPTAVCHNTFFFCPNRFTCKYLLQ